jgi:hypothetical protein
VQLAMLRASKLALLGTFEAQVRALREVGHADDEWTVRLERCAEVLCDSLARPRLPRCARRPPPDCGW